MAVKCNITKNILEWIKLNNWGFSTNVDIQKTIVENYLEYLACPDFSLKPSCNDYSDECNKINQGEGGNGNVDFNCNMNVVGMSYILDPNPDTPEQLSFYLAVGDIYGAKSPLTYKWFYDEDKLELVGLDTDPIVKFKIKEGHTPELLVTDIQLQVVDANGCQDIKTCFYSQGTMKCNNNYQPCYPTSQLSVHYNFVSCIACKSLSSSIYIP